MIVTERLDHGRTVCVRIHGTQSATEFGEFGQVLVETYANARRLLILLDWSALKGWDNEAAASISFQGWSVATPLIERVAIVHAPRWNRQAAVLAAMLRIQNVDVRS